MHRTIYPILRDTGRRLGEIVGVKIGCIEVIDGQHNLVYTTTRSPDCIDACPSPPTSSRPWQRHRTRLTTAPTTRPSGRFPSPLLRCRQACGRCPEVWPNTAV